MSEAFNQVQTSDISLSVARCCCFPLWHMLQSGCTAPLVRKNEELCKRPCCPSASPSPPSHEWQWLQRKQGACIPKKKTWNNSSTESSFRNGSVCAPTPCLSCSPQNPRPRLPANQTSLFFFLYGSNWNSVTLKKLSWDRLIWQDSLYARSSAEMCIASEIWLSTHPNMCIP